MSNIFVLFMWIEFSRLGPVGVYVQYRWLGWHVWELRALIEKAELVNSRQIVNPVSHSPPLEYYRRNALSSDGKLRQKLWLCDCSVSWWVCERISPGHRLQLARIKGMVPPKWALNQACPHLELQLHRSADCMLFHTSWKNSNLILRYRNPEFERKAVNAMLSTTKRKSGCEVQLVVDTPYSAINSKLNDISTQRHFFSVRNVSNENNSRTKLNF